jgi:hypothetical protein
LAGLLLLASRLSPFVEIVQRNLQESLVVLQMAVTVEMVIGDANDHIDDW